MTLCFWAPGLSTGYVFEDIIMFRCVCGSQDFKSKSYFRTWASRSQCLWFSIWKWQYSYVAKTLVTDKYKLLQELHCFLTICLLALYGIWCQGKGFLFVSCKKCEMIPTPRKLARDGAHCSLNFPVIFSHFPFMPSVSFICPHSLNAFIFWWMIVTENSHSFTDICLTVM